MTTTAATTKLRIGSKYAVSDPRWPDSSWIGTYVGTFQGHYGFSHPTRSDIDFVPVSRKPWIKPA